MTKLDQPKTSYTWAFYDWANSAYALVINSTIFPIYFASITKGQDLHIMGMDLEPKAVFGYSLTLSFLILVLISPVLSAMADSRGNKLSFLKFFCLLGSLSCMSLFFFTDMSRIGVCLTLNISASIGFYGSLVFYNAYLPQIASKEKQDRLSALGFSLGYLGSMLMLIISLILISVIASPDNQGWYTRLCFLLTGIWWLGWAQISFAFLPKNTSPKIESPSMLSLMGSSFNGLKSTARELFRTHRLDTFLGAFFFYSVGMQTIFLMATFIGDEIGLGSTQLIGTILCLQLVAIIGAQIMARISARKGNEFVLIVSVFFWIVACVAIFFLDKQNPNVQYYFYAIAGLVGLVMGSLQSMSRSTYSKLLPQTDNPTTFFSFYDVLEKAAIVVGTLSYSLLIEKTGQVKPSALLMAGFFAVNLFFLFKLKKSSTTRGVILDQA